MRAISVAMATFNGASFVEEQLASLARQSLPPVELVVCDDRSEDGTPDAVAAFASRSPFPVRVVYNDERLGSADSFLRAATLCRGELIAFCDQDDVWLEHKLARCAAAFDGGVVLVMHTSRVVDATLRPTGASYPRFDRDAVMSPLSIDPWLPVRGMSMVFSSSVRGPACSRSRPPSHYLESERMHHDEWIYLLARGLGAIALIAEPLALYRRHEKTITGSPPGNRRPLRHALGTGWTYYTRRREQAIALAEVFEQVAAEGGPAHGRCEAAARSYRALAERLEKRLAVYEPDASAPERVTALVRLVRAGMYGRSDGFGPAALARDALMIALGRHG